MSGLDSVIRQIQADMVDATVEVVNNVLTDLHTNIGQFYAGGASPDYQRTGALGNSPKIDYINASGNHVSAQVGLDTGYGYSPQGVDTATIIGYAESGGLAGSGGFWQRSADNVQKHIDDAFGKRFK